MTVQTWTPEIRERIEIALRTLADMRVIAEEMELDDKDTASFLTPYTELLDELYSSDLPLAQLLDESDLVVGATGPALSEGTIPVSTLVSLLKKASGQVVSVAKGIADITGRVPRDMQPSLYRLAPGSLYLGFSAPEPDEEQIIHDGLSYYEAVRQALRAIGTVSELVARHATEEEIEEAIEDPSTRDAVVSAVYKFAPSSKSGLERVFIGGNAVLAEGSSQLASLTREDRVRVKASLGKASSKSTQHELVGTIREIDLDEQRFILRAVDGLDEHASVRCAYEKRQAQTAKAALDRRVRVAGGVDTNRQGSPRFMQVESIRLLDSSSQGPLLEATEDNE